MQYLYFPLSLLWWCIFIDSIWWTTGRKSNSEFMPILVSDQMRRWTKWKMQMTMTMMYSSVTSKSYIVIYILKNYKFTKIKIALCSVILVVSIILNIFTFAVFLWILSMHKGNKYCMQTWLHKKCSKIKKQKLQTCCHKTIFMVYH